jgi:hypothetical protein
MAKRRRTKGPKKTDTQNNTQKAKDRVT